MNIMRKHLSSLICLQHRYEIAKTMIFLAIDLTAFDNPVSAANYIVMDLQLLADDLNEDTLLPIHISYALIHCYGAKFIVDNLNKSAKDMLNALKEAGFNQQYEKVINIDLCENWERFFRFSLSKEEKQQKLEEYTSISILSKEERKNFIKSILYIQ